MSDTNGESAPTVDQEFKTAYTPTEATTPHEGEPASYVQDPAKAEAMAYGGSKVDGTHYDISGKARYEDVARMKSDPEKLLKFTTPEGTVADNLSEANYQAEKAGFFHDHGVDLADAKHFFSGQPELQALSDKFDQQYLNTEGRNGFGRDNEDALLRSKVAARRIVDQAYDQVVEKRKAA